MKNQTQTLYRQILLDLQTRLDNAEAVYLQLSQLIVSGMMRGDFAESNIARLLGKYRKSIKTIIRDVAWVYPGKIRIFPERKEVSLIKKMEDCNAQYEELEKIVGNLLKGNGLTEKREKSTADHNLWRSMMADVDFKTEFEREFDEAASFSKRPNILVAGYTGCGKTSLIRTILGNGIVPQSGIDNGKPCRIDFDNYENDLIRLWDSRGLELGEAESDFQERMRDFVSDCQDDPDVDEHIHLVWYLIQGNGGRVTDCDLALMKEIFTFDNVIAVISKKDITKPEQFAAITKILQDAGVPEHRIIAVSDAEGGAAGCKELVALSHTMLPEAYRDAFMAAQEIDRDAKAEKIPEKAERARAITETFARKAGEWAASFQPEDAMPDAAFFKTLSPTLIEMVAQLASLYGIHGSKIKNSVIGFVEKLLDENHAEFFGKNPEELQKNAELLTNALGNFLRNSLEAFAIARIKGTPLPEPGFDVELFKPYFNNYKKGMMMKPNILVCGKTGVGKTSLIQAVTHRGVVPDSAIGNGAATTEGFQLYETEIANFIDSEGMNPGKQSVDDYADFILDEMLSRLDSADSDALIHNIWYCIDGSGARVLDTDAKIIKTFSDKVLLVVTKCEMMRKEQTESMMKELLDLLPRERIVMVSAENKSGLPQLIAKAQDMSMQAMAGADEEIAAFQDRWDDYYANMKECWQDAVSDEADSYINWAAGRAAAIALIPLPLADVAPLIANEVYMIYKLAGIYGIAVDNTIITTLLGCAGGSLVGKIGASFLPFLKVPIAAGVTYGVGKAAKAYFESDMTMDEDELKEQFLAGEREAKKREWKPISE
ncbi:MAG: hypothetical protein MJ033_02160 [Victivallaceae bacterium]|nr:hypothetical protein [Victivallaceae bacterium]